MTDYPIVRTSGSPHERGRQHGEAARERIAGSVGLYTAAFAAYAGWDWSRVRAAAAGFLPVLDAYDPRYLEEMDGIAEGAAVDVLDIVAINVRTEIMFAAVARDDAARAGEGPAGPRGDGCSGVALLPPATPDGHTLLAQNWDWIEGTRDTTIVLVARPDDGPAFVTIVEAGILAKCGMNACGVGVAVNSLVSGDDRGVPALPYHVCVRSVLEAASAPDALRRLQVGHRSSSANYLVAGGDGLAFDAECRPGDHGDMAVLIPVHGRLFHTNHFIAPRFDGRDVGLRLMYDSPFRLQRLQAQLGEGGAQPATVAGVQAALADHAGHPLGICSHPDAAADAVHQEGTILGVVMDLTALRLWLADGNPCRAHWRELPVADWLS